MGSSADDADTGHGRSVHGAPPRYRGGTGHPLCALPQPARRHRHSVSLLSGVLSLLCVPQRNDGPRGATMARGSVSYTSGPVRGMSGGAYHSAVPGRQAHMPVVRGGVQSQLCPALQSLFRGPLRIPCGNCIDSDSRPTHLRGCRTGPRGLNAGLLLSPLPVISDVSGRNRSDPESVKLTVKFTYGCQIIICHDHCESRTTGTTDVAERHSVRAGHR